MWTGGVRTEAVGNRVGLALHLRAAIVAGASDCEATRFHRNFLHGLLSATPRGSPEQVGRRCPPSRSSGERGRAFLGVGFAIGLALDTPSKPSCGGVEARMALLAIGIPA